MDEQREEKEPSRDRDSPLTDIPVSSVPSESALPGGTFPMAVTEHKRDDKAEAIDVSKINKFSYESSELSDLEEDSEAETDKMDFLDNDDSASENVSDLKTLTNLTNLLNTESNKFLVLGDEKEMSDNNSDKMDSKNGEDLEHATNASTNESEKEIDNIEDGQQHSDSPKMKVSNSIKRSQEDNYKDDRKKTKLPESAKYEACSPSGGHRADEVDFEQIQPLIQKKEVKEEDESIEGKVVEEEEDDYEREEYDEIEEDSDVKQPMDDDNSKEEALQDNEEEVSGDNKESATREDLEDEIESDLDVDINEQRRLAVKDLIDIEGLFAELRDKLFQDKLSLLERELQLCLEGSHPELSKIYYKINQFHQNNLKQVNSNLNYRLKCIDNSTLATRTAIHQNFMRQMVDSKHDLISKTTSLWYKINKERNQMDQIVSEFSFVAVPSSAAGPSSDYNENSTGQDYYVGEFKEPSPISKKESKQRLIHQLVKHRNGYNSELGILNGLIHFYGIPSSSSNFFHDIEDDHIESLLLKKATDDEINDDLMAMGIPI